MPPLDDDDLFDTPKAKPSNKIVYQPAGAQWSLDRLPEVESLYQSTFKKRLPLANRGQGSIHNKWGYDHRDSADVSINPSTLEGQQFVEQLKKANIPFLGFTSAIPGVATGPHIHIGFPSHRTQQKFGVGAQKKSKQIASDDLFDTDDDLFDRSSEQTPPVTRKETTNLNPPVSPTSPASPAPLPPIEQVLGRITRQANRVAPTVRRQAQQPAAAGSSNLGTLRQMDEPEVARIQRLQAEETARAAGAPTFDYMGTLPERRPGRVADIAARRASEERAAETRQQRDAPEMERLTQEYRQEIRQAAAVTPNYGPTQWFQEALHKGEAGLLEAGAGVVRAARYNPLAVGAGGTADKLRLHAEAMQRAAIAEGADRNVVSQTLQDATAGLISTAPELAAMSLGAPPIATFGMGGGLRAYGRGENMRNVAKATAHGAATGAAFELPVPSVLKSPVTRAAVKGLEVGAGTGAVELASGTPPQQAASTAITNALFGAAGELRSRPAEPSQPRTEPLPEPVATAGEHYRQVSTRLFQVNQELYDAAKLPPEQVAALRREHDLLVPEEAKAEQVINNHGYKVNPIGEVAKIGQPFPSSLRDSPELYKPGGEGWDELRAEVQPNVPAQPETAERQPPVEARSAASVEAPRQWQHADFGLVTESPNQKRLGKGRVRVVGENGREHVIKRAALTGAGNQRAIPVKQEPTLEAPSTETPTMYHAGTTPFEQMEVDQIQVGSKGRGLYFAPTPEGTHIYEAAKGRPMADDNVRGAKLNMGRPLILTEPEAINRFVGEMRGLLSDPQRLNEAAQLSKKWGRAETPDDLARNIRSITDATQGAHPDYAYSLIEQNPNLTALAKTLGYDGIVDRSESVVFDRSQIKPTGAPPIRPVEAPPEPTTASVKAFITKADEAALKVRGYSDADIYEMKPRDAQRILSEPATSGVPESVQQRSAEELTNQQVTAKPSTKAGRGARPAETPTPQSEAEAQAFADWRERRAYIDNNGNYRVKQEGASSGKIAPWNREIKAKYKTVKEFHDAANSEQAPAPEVVEPSPESTTSLRKAQMAKDREELDLPELPEAQRKAWQVSLDNAKSKGLDRKADVLADEVLRQPRSLNDEESAGLVLRAQELKNEHARVMREIGAETDPEAIKAKTAERDAIEASFDKVSKAAKLSGSEKGRTLAAQKLTINQDYDLVSVVSRAKAAKGRDLMPSERAEYEALVIKHKALEDQLTELRSQAQAKASTASVDKFVREQSVNVRRAKRQRTAETLKTERAELKQQIGALIKGTSAQEFFKSEKGEFDPEHAVELSRLLSSLARNYIESGVVKAEALVDAVHNEIKDVSELTKREVSDLISGYGRIRKPTSDVVEKKLTELKAILAATSGRADVIEKSVRPLRRGQQREKPTEDQRRALRELRDAMREQGPELAGKPYDPSREQATPLDKAKSTARNRIEQLQKWIAEGKKEVQGQKKVIPDAELTQLRAERDALEKAAAVLDDPAADKRTVERRVSELDKSIRGMRERIASGQIQPNMREGQSALWSEQIGRLEQERVGLRKTLTKMRAQEAARQRRAKAATPEGQEEARKKEIEQRLKTIDKGITGLQEQIRSGPSQPTVKEGGQSAWTPELSRAIHERRTLQRILSDMKRDSARQEREQARAKFAGFYGAEKTWAEFEAEAKRLLNRRRFLEKRVSELEGQIASGDIKAPEPRPQRMPTEEEFRLERRITDAKRKIEEKLSNDGETSLGRLARRVGDVLGLYRAIETSFDVSWALRQGKIGLARHPTFWSKAFIEQFKGLSNDKYFRAAKEIENDPDFRYLNKFGLETPSVDSVHAGSPTYTRAEEFQTELAHKIPGLRQSEQVYNIGLDTLRVMWAKHDLQMLRKAGFNPEKPTDFKVFKEAMQSINDATGRTSLERLIPGKLGEAANRATPAINQLTYAVRFWASRLKVLSSPLDPRMYAQPEFAKKYYESLPRVQRVEAWKRLFAFYGLWGAQAAAMHYLLGFDLELDPDSPDFGKFRRGKRVYDFSAGMVNHLRFAARMAKRIYEAKTGQKPKSTTVDTLGTYLRSKESPVAGRVHDIFLSKQTEEGYGTDFKGAPVYPFGKPESGFFGRLKTSRLVPKPLGLDDAMEAYDQMGWGGVATSVPASVLGEGVQTYPKREPDKRAKRAALTQKARGGQLSDADLTDMAQQGEITETDRKRIAKEAKITEKQARFENYVPATAIDRFERMDASQREEVRDLMEKKAYTLLHSDSLTQEQKDAFAARIDALGLTPQNPRATKSGGFRSRLTGFKSAFRETP